MNKCPICKSKVDNLRTAIKNGQYISERCEKCLAHFSASALYARKYEREQMKTNHRKDLIQRFDGDKISEEFVKAYPKRAAEQFGEEILRGDGLGKKSIF